jgi:hypothetical protein
VSQGEHSVVELLLAIYMPKEYRHIFERKIELRLCTDKKLRYSHIIQATREYHLGVGGKCAICDVREEILQLSLDVQRVRG